MTNVDAPEAHAGRRSWLLIAAVVVVVIAAAAGVYFLLRPQPAAAEVFTVRGQLVLPDDAYAWGSTETSCVGGRGFDDIRPGAQVVVADQAGTTLAIGALGTSKVTTGADGRLAGCTIAFAVPDVPAGGKFYRLSVGRRGGLQYTEQQLRTDLRLTLS